MLGDFPSNPILPAQNGDRARSFYRDVLGLELMSAPDQDPMMLRAGGCSTIVLSEMPDRVPPPYPVVSFLVTGLEKLVTGLRDRGVTFVPLPDGTFAGLAGRRQGAITDFGPVRSAWLRDPEGNLLALNELV